MDEKLKKAKNKLIFSIIAATLSIFLFTAQIFAWFVPISKTDGAGRFDVIEQSDVTVNIIGGTQDGGVWQFIPGTVLCSEISFSNSGTDASMKFGFDDILVTYPDYSQIADEKIERLIDNNLFIKNEVEYDILNDATYQANKMDFFRSFVRPVSDATKFYITKDNPLSGTENDSELNAKLNAVFENEDNNEYIKYLTTKESAVVSEEAHTITYSTNNLCIDFGENYSEAADFYPEVDAENKPVFDENGKQKIFVKANTKVTLYLIIQFDPYFYSQNVNDVIWQCSNPFMWQTLFVQFIKE